MLDLNLDRAPVAPKDAATIILVRARDARDASGRVESPTPSEGIEIFCVERSKESRFLGGAVVFPGGKVDPSDFAEEWTRLTTSPRTVSERSIDFARDESHRRALAVAACRETLEEAAMLHVTGEGAAATVTQADIFALRARLTTAPAALQAFLRERDLKLDLGAIHPFARWVTPEAEARRFDTRFFVAIAPAEQTGAHDEHETTASFWATPTEVLRRWEAFAVQLAPPTHHTLLELSACGTIDDVLALAEARALDPICPRLVRHVEDGIESLALTLPGDPEHEVGDGLRTGPSRYVLRNGRWLAENAPR